MATCCQVQGEQVRAGYAVMESATRTRSAVENEVEAGILEETLEAGILEGTCSFECDTERVDAAMP